MLEKILKLYVTYMAYDVRSPMPHLEGPPGCGKSTVIEQLADLVGRTLHTINVSRLSPLEVEGVQMPHGSGEEMVLRMLPATFWTSLEEGDIVNFDEFLRGFPEVYNALLDIFTSRRVGSFVLPKVFIIGASNSAIAYDPALEDRLLHLPVPDPRTDKQAKKNLAEHIVGGIGLNPEVISSMEMRTLIDTQVLPMFNVLDSFKKGGSSAPSLMEGKSVRNLIGQALLREVQTSELRELIDHNNRVSITASKWQYVVLPEGKNPPANYMKQATQLPIDKLTDLQRKHLEVNTQLVQMEEIRLKKEGPTDDDAVDTDPDDIFSL